MNIFAKAQQSESMVYLEVQHCKQNHKACKPLNMASPNRLVSNAACGIMSWWIWFGSRDGSTLAFRRTLKLLRDAFMWQAYIIWSNRLNPCTRIQSPLTTNLFVVTSLSSESKAYPYVSRKPASRKYHTYFLETMCFSNIHMITPPRRWRQEVILKMGRLKLPWISSKMLTDMTARIVSPISFLLSWPACRPSWQLQPN